MEQDMSGEIRYRFGDVEVDTRRHRVLRGGVELALEPKAHAVLVELLRRAGDVVGRDALLDAVWGHSHVTPAVLNRIIAILRRELGDDAEHPHLIRTVHGVGYEFIGTLEAPADDPAASSLPVAPAPPAGLADAANPARPPTRLRRPVSPAMALLTVAVVIVIAAGWAFWSRPSSAPAGNVESSATHGIAVLPLVNASGDANQQFFTDGISENLINTLSQFDGLKVIGRGSSFQFRDNKEGGKAIGAKLGVAHLIEGSVQRANDNVRISIELIRTADGSTMWTQRFDRPYKDLFALQDEVALAVAGALQVRLLHRMPSAVETGRPASGNLEAYAAYLRGTSYMNNDPRKAIKPFEEATRLDPGYTQAWSWLGFQRLLYANMELEGEAARATYAQAREDIDTALRLEPNFGQAHAIRANLLSSANHDWNGALAEFRIALPLVPNTDPTHGAVSRLLATLGRVNEAIVERRKYIEGDPLAGFARIYLAELLASRGQLDEAEASLRKAMELDPDAHDWHASQRSYLAILRGDADAARTEAESMAPGRGRDRTLTLALQIGNDRAAADAALKRLVESDGEARRGPYAIAQVHALRGDADEAFEWLQRDWDRRDTGVHYVLFDPLLLRFRDDPHFAAYCRQAGLPAPSESEALGFERIRAVLAAQR